MRIQQACEMLKEELLDNGYEYGYYLNGKIYKPDMVDEYDGKFFDLLVTEYRVQDPEDTKQAKVGTCNDVVLVMKSMLDEQKVPSKIWLLHDKERDRFHTILTFYLENKAIYLELTPRFDKPWYGKELIFENEQSFIAEQEKNNCEAIEVTDSVFVGEAPNFVLSRMGLVK